MPEVRVWIYWVTLAVLYKLPALPLSRIMFQICRFLPFINLVHKTEPKHVFKEIRLNKQAFRLPCV